jgi:hypothetical protein
MQQRDKEIAMLRCELSRQAQVHQSAVDVLSRRFAWLEAELTRLRSTKETVTAPTLTQLQIDLKNLKDSVEPLTLTLQNDVIATLWRLQDTLSALKAYTGALPSLIVWDFPEIFTGWQEQRFLLRWRGSWAGVGARDFHGRCDGHANSLTVILDTNGNIFGGFTSVQWQSRVWNGRIGNENNGWKVDPTLNSFLFTLKNPHPIPTQRFALKAIIRNYAIDSTFHWGTALTGIGVHDNCNANANSWIDIGNCHTNNTELNEKTVFTGSLLFQVKEIEVFEITG